jgi:hypothetical protein
MPHSAISLFEIPHSNPKIIPLTLQYPQNGTGSDKKSSISSRLATLLYQYNPVALPDNFV